MKFSRFRLLLLIFWLILAGLIVWFKVVPFGKMTYYVKYPVDNNIFGGKGFIGHFSPADRVNNFKDQWPEIIGDPVYFSVFTPRTFNEAKVTVTYQDNLGEDTPVIEAGVLVDNIVWRYKLASLENKILDSDFSNWTRLQEDGIILLQKNKTFSGIAEFVSVLESEADRVCGTKIITDCVALYNASIKNSVTPKSVSDFKLLDIPLQGTHQFYFSAESNQNLEFIINFTDLNLDTKDDQVVVSIYQENNKIYSKTISDDFGDEGSGVVREFEESLVYKLENQKKDSYGMYKLEIKTSNDVVIKKITKAPSALSIIGRVHPVNTNNQPLSLWTDSSFIKLTTNNPASRQKIKFGSQVFSLADPYQQYEFSSKDLGLKEVVLNKDDVILETDGVFSLSPDSFFNPDFKKVDRNFVMNSDLEYILADYQSPKFLDDNFKQATVVLETKEAYREKGKYSFMISVPGLSLINYGNDKNDSLLIKEIKIEFSGRTIWDKIKEYVN